MFKKKLDIKQLIASLSEIIPNIFALEKWLLFLSVEHGSCSCSGLSV